MIENFNYDVALEHALTEAQLFESTISAQLSRLIISDTRRKLSFLLVVAALEHYRAVLHLLDEDDGAHAYSAFALVRPIAEAAFRGIWVALFANEGEVSMAASNDPAFEYPSLKKITKEMQKKFDWKDNDVSQAVYENFIYLCGFVHTDVVPLNQKERARRTGQFPSDVALDMLQKSSLYLWVGAFYLAQANPNIDAMTLIDDAHNRLIRNVGPPWQPVQSKTLLIN